MSKLILVDDEKIILDSLSGYIRKKMPEFEVCGMFYDGEDALKYLLEHPVDIIITDITMPIMGGLELAREVCNRFPSCITIIISGYSEFEYARTALKYNVMNYLLKPLNFDELKMCLYEADKLSKTKKTIPISNTDLQSEETEDFITHLMDSDLNYRPAPNDAAIQKAIQFIEQNYALDLTREMVADNVFLSPSYFSYQFKKKTGISFFDFLTNIRMQKAIELLNTKMKVGEIAEKVGYQSKNRFFVNFRQYTSFTPTEYRKIILSMGDSINDN